MQICHVAIVIRHHFRAKSIWMKQRFKRCLGDLFQGRLSRWGSRSKQKSIHQSYLSTLLSSIANPSRQNESDHILFSIRFFFDRHRPMEVFRHAGSLWNVLTGMTRSPSSTSHRIVGLSPRANAMRNQSNPISPSGTLVRPTYLCSHTGLSVDVWSNSNAAIVPWLKRRSTNG